MKKTCILIFFSVLAFMVRAHAGINDGILSITNLSRQNVIIEIDGRTYSDVTSGLFLRDFRQGNHTIKVLCLVKEILTKRVTLYSKTVYVKPKTYIDLVINRFGRVWYDEQPITDNRYDNDDRNVCDDRNNSNNNNNWPPRDNNNNSNNHNNWPPRDNNNNNNNNNNNWPPRNNNYPPRPMDDNTFTSFIETVRRESFDDSRMAIAKSVIDQNYFLSAQVKQLSSLFSFENSKLEISKYMYGRTTDPKNYFVVYSVFSFSKTKEELAEYVRTYKP